MFVYFSALHKIILVEYLNQLAYIIYRNLICISTFCIIFYFMFEGDRLCKLSADLKTTYENIGIHYGIVSIVAI